ncbi:MAG: polymer-forming cytoskeletal protein, partial [Acidobacteria bacterium Pan2503]|nr:polymer-forming cytoskeletal protein [Candidatus Acidoferrum panamensis]
MSETEEKMKHLDEMTCLLYLERQLDRARGLEVSLHTQECQSCRTLLRALERESRLLTRAMFEDNEPLPSRLAQFQEAARRSMQWIWALAFGLAATGVYALYTEYIEPWQRQLHEAGFNGTNLLGLLIFQSPFWKGWQSVITLLEFLALATLGGLGLMFLRRRIRRGSALALVFASLCAALLAPTQASATEFRKGDRITIGKDEVVHSDLYVAGGQIRIGGTIEGDLVVAGGDVEVSGHVLGDMLSTSGQVRMTGQVDGSIRGYAGNITIKGKVGRNVMSFGGDVNLDHDALITGSVTTGSGRLSLDGHVGRDLLAFAGQSNISGDIGGAAKIYGGELNIDSSADIRGPVDFEGDKEPQVSPQAKLASPVHFVKQTHGPNYSNPHYYIWQLIWASAYILFGLVLFALMPAFSSQAVNSLQEHLGATLGLAVLVGFGLFVAALIACVTVVGLFVGLATLALWFGTLYFGLVVVGAQLGQWLMGRTKEFWPLVGRMCVGVVIIRVLAMIPQVGWIFKYGAAFWGLGAISLVIFRRFQPVPATGLTVPP